MRKPKEKAGNPPEIPLVVIPRPGKPGIHFVVEGGGPKAGGGKDGKAKATTKVGAAPGSMVSLSPPIL